MTQPAYGYPLSQAGNPNSAPLQGGNNGNAVSAGSYQFQPYPTGAPIGARTLNPGEGAGSKAGQPSNTATGDFTPYWGQNSATDAYAGRMSDMSSAALNASAPVADLSNANQDRGYGMQALGLAQGAAMGNAPSAAQSQFGQNLNAAMMAQQSAANSARGGGAGLAAAQQQGSMQQAAMAGQGAQQAAMLRAQEMAQARAQYGQMASGMGAQDAQNAFGQAGLQSQQNAMNQQGALQWAGLGQDALNSQLSADTSRYANDLGLQGAGMAGNQQMASNMMGAGMGMATGMLSKAAGS